MDNANVFTKFSEVEPRLKQCKHAKLQDVNGKDIVPFNSPKTKVQPRIDEIKRKLQLLPDGLYCILTQDRFGKNVHQERFYLQKGKPQGELIIPPVPVTVPAANGTPEKKEHLLSLENAVSNIEKAAKLEAENQVLKNENERLKLEVKNLKDQVESLQADFDNLEEEPERGAFADIAPFLNELAPILPSIADKFFQLQERKDETERVKTLLKYGYDVPGLKPTAAKPAQKRKAEMPQPGTEAWEQYVEEVRALPDEQFEQHLALIEEKFPDLYEHLYTAVYEDQEGEGE